MKKAFVDLDGTLIDSRNRHISVLQEILEEFHIMDKSVDNFVQYKSEGVSTKNYLENELQIEPAIAEEISLRWMESIELDRVIDKDIWYEDVTDFLTFLKKSKYWVVVVSARKNRNGILKFIEKSKYVNLLDEIIIVSPVNAKENKKKYILRNLADANIVIGDSEADYVEDIHIRNFLLNRGFRSENYWKKRKIMSYNSLYEIIFEIMQENQLSYLP